MAIDFIVDYPCIPKEQLGTGGIVERLKGRARAEAVIELFRQHGDDRSPAQMGFEFTRSTPDGAEETRVIVVQDLLDEAAALDPLAFHCVGCPANVSDQPFGCINFIQYPVSAAAEAWLLKQLPMPDEPLPWLLLRQAVTEMGYDGTNVEPLRAAEAYFADRQGLARGLGEFQVTSNQVFEMLFMLGHLQPAHAGMLLVFFGAVRRDLEANELHELVNRELPPDALREKYPFLHTHAPDDDATIAEFKLFFRALYTAWNLGVRLLLDV